ncbi:MAG TPA: hypothetical protein VNU27_14215 [Candidatus Acidoferrum sp.]|nr:hypothetical protein [Candidatus Angelobacter sp.]HXD82718.1 hypothetical protein [Candidatus Acidoferrum sp.]
MIEAVASHVPGGGEGGAQGRVGSWNWRRAWQNWRLPLLTGLALAIVTSVPYLYAYAVQPSGHVFMGFFYLGDDANTYLAKMRQGWEGSWSWQNRYTTEPSPAAYLFMFWIVLGHLAALLNLPLIVVFHLARVAAAFALMAAAWAMICHFIEDATARKFAFFFVAIGLGMGYVIQALGHPVIFGNQTDTLDWRMPELTAFYSVLALPHFAWSGVFAAAGIALTFKAMQRGSLVLGALGGLAWLGQASIHPQMPILMGGATAIALLLRPAARRGWVAAGLAFAIPAPYILYSYLAFIGNPEVQRWTFHSKNALPPDTISLLFALAPQVLLALVGLPGALRRRTREDVFLVAWLVLLAVILYVPNPAGDLRRRFLDGIYLPLGILGARGMYEAILPRLRSVRARALVPFTYVSFAAIGSAFLTLAPLAVAANPEYSATTAEYNGLTWLGTEPTGRVLSMPGVGLYVPAYSPDTVYVGHYDETFDYVQKTQTALAVLTGKSDLEQFISANHIRYVVWTSDLPTPPPQVLGAAAYDTATFKIWKVY